MDWRGGKGMQEILSLALGFLEGNFAKKGETVTVRLFDFFGNGKVAGASGFARVMPSW